MTKWIQSLKFTQRTSGNFRYCELTTVSYTRPMQICRCRWWRTAAAVMIWLRTLWKERLVRGLNVRKNLISLWECWVAVSIYQSRTESDQHHSVVWQKPENIKQVYHRVQLTDPDQEDNKYLTFPSRSQWRSKRIHDGIVPSLKGQIDGLDAIRWMIMWRWC